jgi:uncharacterized membrane protein YjgN (DUF898 family)
MSEIRMVWRVKAIVRMTDGGMADWWANAIAQGWMLESIDLVGEEDDRDLSATFRLDPDDERSVVIDPDEIIL